MGKPGGAFTSRGGLRIWGRLGLQIVLLEVVVVCERVRAVCPNTGALRDLGQGKSGPDSVVHRSLMVDLAHFDFPVLATD